MYDKAKQLVKWLNTKMFLHEKYNTNPLKFRNYHTPRGSIFTCHFGENIGDEKCGMGRPVLIVSNERLNKTNGNIVVVTLSKNIKYADISTKKLKFDSHYALYKTKYGKLAFDSCVQCEDIKVISKSRLGTLICHIDKSDMLNIKKRLKYVLDI